MGNFTKNTPNKLIFGVFSILNYGKKLLGNHFKRYFYRNFLVQF